MRVGQPEQDRPRSRVTKQWFTRNLSSAIAFPSSMAHGAEHQPFSQGTHSTRHPTPADSSEGRHSTLSSLSPNEILTASVHSTRKLKNLISYGIDVLHSLYTSPYSEPTLGNGNNTTLLKARRSSKSSSQFGNISLVITSHFTTIPPDCETLKVPTLSEQAALDTFYRMCKYGGSQNRPTTS